MTIAKFLLVLIAFVAFNGCATNKTIILHPIDKVDIVEMKKGVAYAPEKEGFFLSTLYLKEVMDAKVEKIKKTS